MLDPVERRGLLRRMTDLQWDGRTRACLGLGGRDAALQMSVRDLDSHRRNFDDAPGTARRKPEGVGLKLAQLAFANDPDPAVRTRAMFAITGNADSRTGEKTLMAVLDDSTFTADPSRLGSIVGALQNLASIGDYNAVDRIGKRLMKRTGLRAGDRRQLELILRRVLPSDATFPPTAPDRSLEVTSGSGLGVTS